MKFAIYSDDYVGSAEWRKPGEVVLEMDDPTQQSWFEAYFAAEESFLGGTIDAPQMMSMRRNATEEAFAHSAFALAAYHYTVRNREPTSQRAEEP